MGCLTFLLTVFILSLAPTSLQPLEAQDTYTFFEGEDVLPQDRGAVVQPPTYIPHDRKQLLNLLGNDVNRFRQKQKISNEDEEIVDDVLISFLHDPPLRSGKELATNKGVTRREIRIANEKYRKYRGAVEGHRDAVFKQLKDGGRTFIKSTRQAYDLDRVLLLKEVFTKYYFHSRGIELLYNRIVADMKMTMWA